ncbi:MAG TPA: sigma 54-interacting transcriptional regulator, partial [Acidocella sp.]|nr:sigma 54-interacting transcriptional regulator [Acidocella sp.]
RVLQEGEYTTVGGRQPIRAYARIVAATHRDLRALIRSGQFREDLFYRLNVVPIRLPPLRERPDDIPVLAQHFLNKAQSEGLPAKTIDPAAMALLSAYRWPGNVRELENVIRRLAALVPQPVITEAIIAQELADYTPVEAPVATTPGEENDNMTSVVERHIARLLTSLRESGEEGVLYERALAELERPLIRMTLAETRGNQIRAAALLGLNRNTLRKKIREHGIGVQRRVG